MQFPVRINKYLAEKGIATRRGADLLIRDGKVKVNGRRALLGERVLINDKIEVVDFKKRVLFYFAYNKPTGIVTHSPQPGEKEIKDAVSLPKGVFPIGRLDKDSEGLIILTNDGRITDKLLNPKFSHEKEYVVTVDKPITNTFLVKIKGGLKTIDFQARPAKIRKIAPRKFEIILTEGKNRQIRRMTAALGYNICRLQRVRIMNFRLGSLRIGSSRLIKGKELANFLKSLGLF